MNNPYGGQYNGQMPNQQYPQYQQNPYGNPYQQQGGYQMPPQPELGMTFNTVYAVLMLVSGGFSVLNALTTMFSEGGLGMGIIYLLLAAFNVATGIFLLKRTKVGYIMRLIDNIWSFVVGGFGVIGGIMIMVGSIAGSGLLASIFEGVEGMEVASGMLGTIGAILGVIAIIGSAVSIVLNILIMKYYKKRKHLFN